MTPRPKRNAQGARWRRLVAFVVNRDFGRCWICGHWAAHSADHLIPVTEDPSLEWDVKNLKAAHGYPKGCPDCTIAAVKRGGKPVYCNEIRQYGSVERARRKIEERTGLRLPIGDTATVPEGRDCWLLTGIAPDGYVMLMFPGR